MADGSAARRAGREEGAGRTQLSSVATAIRLLKSFGLEERELGISELALRLGVSKSTVHRVASTLLSEGLLEQNPETDRYRLGVVLFELGSMVRRRMDLTAEAKRYLIALRDTVEENVRLTVLSHENVLYVYDFESPQAVRLRSQTGLSKPAATTAEGWLLLAGRPAAEVAAAAAAAGEELDTLEARIAEAGAQGWAYEDQVSEPGMRCLAAPIRSRDGRTVAVVSIAGPRERIRKRMLPQLTNRLMATVQEIAARVGWRE